MTFLQYVKYQIERGNAWKLHIMIDDKEYPEFSPWFGNPTNDWQNCKAFCAMIGEKYDD
ncbi:MAG: hypothetical protein LBI13_04010 [Streptococcaceae bacterium]|jgi:hypothetical protein|nr:hypothetical protein [Streptococcaceae bacterium]